MKEIKSTKKLSFSKKLLIKICRFLGYEVFDQRSLEFPAASKNNLNYLSTPGIKSFTLGLGQTNIKRKIECLDIVVKTCASVQLVSQNKKRIFEKDKLEYTFRTLKSLYKSANSLKEKYKDILIKFTIIDAGSSQSDFDKIKNLVKNQVFDSNFIKLDNTKIDKGNNMESTMSSIKKSFELSEKFQDLIYFVEDDYIHKIDSLSEMVLSYEKFSTILDDEIFLLSTDYPYLYKKLENSIVLIGDKYHWRSVEESLLTFMTSKKMIRKHFSKLIEMATKEDKPFEKNLHEIYKKEKCFSPIPSLSIHCANINSVFGVSPNVDIKRVWDESK